MRTNTIAIMKKELARFFGDRRLLFTTVIMPGLLIYILYSFMGNGMVGTLLPDENYVAKAYVQNMPEELSEIMESLAVEWTRADGQNTDNLIQEIVGKQADALVVFPENFLEEVTAYQVESGTAAPNVEIYYNSAEADSYHLYQAVTGVLDFVEESMANKMDINAGEGAYDCATQEEVTGQMFSMLLPMLLMIFLYSGCVSVAPESIAGEKERGTIATLLVTPMKRSSLALGKVFSLSIIALLSGLSSFVGTMLSLPKLMGGEMTGLGAATYSPLDYLLLLGVILSTVLVLVSAISVISAFSKSVKEAGTAVSPLMILNMFISLTPMFVTGEVTMYQYCIPLYNSVQCMNGIFSFAANPSAVGITILVNLTAAGGLTFVLTRIFNSERIMF